MKNLVGETIRLLQDFDGLAEFDGLELYGPMIWSLEGDQSVWPTPSELHMHGLTRNYKDLGNGKYEGEPIIPKGTLLKILCKDQINGDYDFEIIGTPFGGYFGLANLIFSENERKNDEEEPDLLIEIV